MNQFNEDMCSKKLAVCRVLRDHPELRKIENRTMVWKYAKQYRPDLSMVDCDRLCRHIQNTEGLYKSYDGRLERQTEYYEYFCKENE